MGHCTLVRLQFCFSLASVSAWFVLKVQETSHFLHDRLSVCYCCEKHGFSIAVKRMCVIQQVVAVRSLTVLLPEYYRGHSHHCVAAVLCCVIRVFLIHVHLLC